MSDFKKNTYLTFGSVYHDKTITDKAGNVVLNKETGEAISRTRIALGSKKNKDPKYNTTVELTVRDNDGNIIHQQTDGFLEMRRPFAGPKTPESLKWNVLTSSYFNKKA